MSHESLRMDCRDGVCTVRFARESEGNPINARFVRELGEVVDLCRQPDGPSVLLLTGQPGLFCLGGDLQQVSPENPQDDPEPLYELWRNLSAGPFVSVAVVEGKANAGGVGLAAACDVVLAGASATFSLSELLFGLFPACVLPFLARRIGFQRAHYMTLMTQPISAQQALQWGLADAVGDSAEELLRKHLLKLRRLAKPAIGKYKRYAADAFGWIEQCRPSALAANRAMFADPEIREGIRRYVAEGKFPWEP